MRLRHPAGFLAGPSQQLADPLVGRVDWWPRRWGNARLERTPLARPGPHKVGEGWIGEDGSDHASLNAGCRRRVLGRQIHVDGFHVGHRTENKFGVFTAQYHAISIDLSGFQATKSRAKRQHRLTVIASAKMPSQGRVQVVVPAQQVEVEVIDAASAIAGPFRDRSAERDGGGAGVCDRLFGAGVFRGSSMRSVWRRSSHAACLRPPLSI